MDIPHAYALMTDLRRKMMNVRFDHKESCDPHMLDIIFDEIDKVLVESISRMIDHLHEDTVNRYLRHRQDYRRFEEKMRPLQRPTLRRDPNELPPPISRPQ